MHILLVEDDLALGQALQKALKTDGFSSEWLRRAADVPQSFNEFSYDCVLLDLSLPDGDGMDLLKRWRLAGSDTPIIVITARSALQERLAGLDGGADDFIIKPFASAELVSRIHAVLRRHARQSNQVWAVGDLEIEPRRLIARQAGRSLDLSPREFHLLVELAREAGTVVQKGILSRRMEPLGDVVSFASIEVHIFNLRRKIGTHRIRTVHGVGYMLTV